MAKKMRRLFSLILALSMVLSLLSTNAFAVKKDGHLEVTDTDYIEVDGVKYHVHYDACFPVKCTKNHTHSSPSCFNTLGEHVCGYETATADMVCELACLSSKKPSVTSNNSRAVTPGTAPYVFQWRHVYQFSNHESRYKKESAEAIPQVFLLLDTTAEEFAETGTWKHNGSAYEAGVSNYTLTYCCDMVTDIDHTVYYRQINLEDAEYYTEAQANQIRAIVMNSYPFISFDEMLQNMYAAGAITEAEKDQIDYSDVLAAVQFAIWSYSNFLDVAGAANYKSSMDENVIYDGVHYAGTASRTNGFLTTPSAHKPGTGTYNFFYPEVSNRIEKIKDYLFNLTPVEEETADIVVSEVEVKDLQYVAKGGGSYTAKLKVALNSGCDDDDEIVLTAKNVTTGEIVSVPVTAATEYELELTANMTDKIEVGVSGTQMLEKGVYFFEPEAKDVNKDGVATAREVSQNLVGYAAGPVPVGDSVVLETVDVELNKVDESGAALTGAEFALSHNGVVIDTYAVDENGKVTISGLMPGVTYELEETKVPEGYVGLKKAIKFVVSGDGKAEIKLIDAPEGVRGEIKSSKRILTVTNALPRVIDWHDKEIIIYTPEELVEFAKVSKDQADCNHEGCELGNHTFEGQKIILGNDIDLGMIDGEEGWWYFDKYEFAEGESKIDLRIVDFRGTFDGAGNTIYNMKYYDEKGSSKPSEAFLALGMFRVLYGTVQDLTIDGVGGYFKDKFAAEKELLPAQTARSTRFFSLAYKTCGALIDGVTVKNIDVEMNNNVEDDVYSSFNGMLGIVTWESGGTCGNGKYTAVNDCHVVNATALVKGNSQYAGGGLAYKASEMASFTDCSVSNVTVDIKGSVDNYGGFIGEIGLASVVDNCDVDGFTLTAAQNNYGVGGFMGDTVGGTGWGDSLHATGCDVMNSQITIGTLNAPLGGFIGDLLGGRSSIITGCKVYPTVTLTVKDLVEGSDAGVGGFIGGLTGRDNLTTSSEHLIYGCNSYANINTINAPAGGFVGAAVKGDGNQMRVVFDTCVADGKIVAKDADAYGFGGFDSGKDIGSKEAGDKSYDEYINCGDYNDVYGDEPETGDQVRTFAGTSTYSRLSAEGYSELTDTTEGSTLYTTYQTPEVAATYNLRFRSVAPASTDNTVEVSFYRYNADGEYENWRTIELYKETAFDGTGYVYADSSEGYRLEGGLASVAAQTEENTDMVFLGWADADGNEFTESTLVCADVEVYAQYGYTVSYEYIGEVPAGAPELPAATDYAVGAEVIVANAPTLAGYNFSGWTAEPALEDGKMPEGDVVISGYWVKIGAPMVPPVVEEEPTEEDVIEEDILDEDAPLDEAPVVDSDAVVEENADENAPMADVPETGDMTALWVAMSAVSAAGLFIVNKKSKDEE